MRLLHLQGVVLFLTALFLFAVIDTSFKYLSVFIAVPLLLWLRFAVHLLVMLILVAPSQGRALVVTQRPWLTFLRALMLTCSSLLLQLAFRFMPLAETSSLFFINPLLVALLARPLLGEKLRMRTWLAIMAGFSGALLIARPGGALVGEGVLYTVCAAFCYAVYQVLTRQLSRTEPVMRQLFYTALIGTIAMSPVLAMYRLEMALTLLQSLLALSLGVLAGVGHFLFIRAFRDSPASSLSPMLYFQIVWVTLLGWLVFDQHPDGLSTLGMLVIAASGLALIMDRPRHRNVSADVR